MRKTRQIFQFKELNASVMVCYVAEKVYVDDANDMFSNLHKMMTRDTS